jgi:hypothetical protein
MWICRFRICVLFIFCPRFSYTLPYFVSSRYHPHRQHKDKKEADLISFNYGEEGGALRWSSFYKAMAPPSPKSKDKKDADSSETTTTATIITTAAVGPESVADTGAAADDDDDHDKTITVSANDKKTEKKKKGRRPAKRMVPKKPPLYTYAQWSKSMQYAEMVRRT